VSMCNLKWDSSFFVCVRVGANVIVGDCVCCSVQVCEYVQVCVIECVWIGV